MSRTSIERSPLLRPRRLSLGLLMALGFNLMLAPALHAATSGTLTRGAAYALGLLGLGVLGLALYLSIVIFQPERF